MVGGTAGHVNIHDGETGTYSVQIEREREREGGREGEREIEIREREREREREGGRDGEREVRRGEESHTSEAFRMLAGTKCFTSLTSLEMYWMSPLDRLWGRGGRMRG